MRSHARIWGLLGGLGLATALVVACGGSSSSTSGPAAAGGGGSSGAVVQGQIVNRRTASGESVMFVVLRTALGIGLAEAAPGAPVANVTVILTRQDDGATTEGTTDTNGQFTFPNVIPGTYTITVVDPDPPPPTTLTVTDPDSFTVGTGDAATITVTVTEGVATDTVNVAALESDPTIVLANPAQVAHLLNIAKAAGHVSGDLVFELRVTNKWGWGKIAKHLGVHPSVIGLGKGGVSDAEIAAFQASHGNGKGNGNGNGKGKGKKKA